MSYQTLTVCQSDRLLTVTLNRPDVRNALNDRLIADLSAVFKKEALSSEIRVVVIKGAGAAFSAGGDLAWMEKSASFTKDKNLKDAKKLSSLLQAMDQLPKPLIGCVHGAALGGGMGLICVCDYVLASQETLFGFPEVRIGLIPAVIAPFVLSKIGPSQTRALFLSAERFPAKKAFEIGLIHQVAPSDEALTQTTQTVVQKMLEASPGALSKAKKLVSELTGKKGKSRHDHAARALAAIRSTAEAREGIESFLQKRKPNW